MLSRQLPTVQNSETTEAQLWEEMARSVYVIAQRLGLHAVEQRAWTLMAQAVFDSTLRLALCGAAENDVVAIEALLRLGFAPPYANAWRILTSPNNGLLRFSLCALVTGPRFGLRLTARAIGLALGDIEYDEGLTPYAEFHAEGRVASLIADGWGLAHGGAFDEADVPADGGVVAPVVAGGLVVDAHVYHHLAMVLTRAAPSGGATGACPAPSARWAPADDTAVVADGEQKPLVVVVLGKPGHGRRLATLAALGGAVLQVRCAALAADGATCLAQLRAVAREALLADADVLLTNTDTYCGGEDANVNALVAWACEAIVIATQGRVRLAITAQTLMSLPAAVEAHVITMPALTRQQRTTLWQRAVVDGNNDDISYLSQNYVLAPSAMAAVGRQLAGVRGHGIVTALDVQRILTEHNQKRLGHLAQRVRITAAWEDLVLPQAAQSEVEMLLARMRDRIWVNELWGRGEHGCGVVALLAGPPGTGKTMTAGLLAQAMGLDLFVVDLSRMVSKWMGETQKNLAAVFDAAEACGAVLLFDEADALFAKRSEVKSSNDRGANMETNYLLQRLERFTGIALLTSNHPKSMDEAFRRRLAAYVSFDAPKAQERERIWRTCLPIAARSRELDFRALAEAFEMGGGNIKNAATRGVFIASDRRMSVSTAVLMEAAEREYEQMGRLLPR